MTIDFDFDFVAVAFLDRFERFAKCDAEIATVRLFYPSTAPSIDLTQVQFAALPESTRLAIRNAGSAAGLVDTEHKSNA